METVMLGSPGSSDEAGARAPRRFAAQAVSLIAAWIAMIPSDAARAAEADQPPNIVFIIADDLGYGAVGCYGQTRFATPHIDRLAKEGLRFTQAYSGHNVCQPSRCVLMTGKHTGHTPVRTNSVDQMLRPDDVTVAEVLKQRGYATGGFGKWGQGFEGTTGHPNRQGFDRFFGQLLQVHAHFYYPYWVWNNEERHLLPENEGGKRGAYVADVTHREALKFIRDNRDGPFFAYLPYIIPHVELVVPEDSEAPFRGKFPKRAIVDNRKGYISSEDGLATYAGMVTRLDRYVGEVLALLAEIKIDERTLVVFTSDNGGQNGGKDGGWTAMTDYFRANGPLRGYKGEWYEGGVRVPFVARWPGRIAPGRVSDHICGFQDVLPTLAEIAGGEAPGGLDGVSLVPTLTGKGKQLVHPLYWEAPAKDGISRAARMGRWKAIQKGPQFPVELYDLEVDIGEKTDVAKQHPDVVDRLVKYLDESHAAPPAFPRQTLRQGIEVFVR